MIAVVILPRVLARKETLRFKDEDEYEILLKVFSLLLLLQTARKASLHFFLTKKLALLFLLKQREPSSGRKMINESSNTL